MSKHLWEVKHPYYCNEGNYFNNECGHKHKSWADFIEDMGDADMDLNLVFRWDWEEEDSETGDSTFHGDPYYRNGRLLIFYMGQRKGLYTFHSVEVCRADEPAVTAFLQPRLQCLMDLWEPLALTAPAAPGEGRG